MENSKSNTPAKKFRKDINGLRAIAVLSVLVFHLFSFKSLSNIDWNLSFAGGYVGVDIFFVISGFLMTAIIISGIKSESFSILNFWKRRAKRICPALLVAIVIFYLISFLLLVNVKEFYEFNKEASAALGFVSNLRFARDEGYFAVDSMSKMLLHTWSLSLEWQFYLIYPILILAAKKFLGFKAIKFTVIVLFFSSLCLSFVFSSEKYYYMLYTRAWELLAGALVYLFPLNKLISLNIKSKWGLEFIGLILILSIFLRDNNEVWSTLLVLPTVIGTMLITAVRCEKSILSNAIFQYIGKISYSLYIYHWLVLSIFARINLGSNIPLTIFTILILSILSYQLIENSRNYGWKFFFLYLAVAGLTIYTTDKKGFSERYLETTNFGGEGSLDFKPCFNNQENRADFILIGDSHAQHFWSFFKEKEIDIALFCTSGTYCYDEKNCTFSKPNFVHDINNLYGSLDNFIKEREKFIASFPDTTPVVVSQKWVQHFNENVLNLSNKDPGYFDKQIKKFKYGLGKLFEQFPQKNFYVLGSLVGSSTIYTVRECNNIKQLNKYIPPYLLGKLECGEPKIKYDNRYIQVNNLLKEFLADYKNVTYIDPNDAICKNGSCKVVDSNNKSYYWDDNHLSKEGAEVIGKYILNNIK